MTDRWRELIGGPFRASWRAGLAWIVALVLFVVSTVAFWPAFRETTSLGDMMKMIPPAMVEAFGLEDLFSPAGYLRGGLYEVLIPLMFAVAGVLFVNSAVAGEEDSGRLELLLAQPVTRRSFYAGRSLAVLAWLVILTVVTLVSQLASDVAYDLQIADDRLIPTVVLCGLLGVFYASVALAVAGLVARPGLVLAVGLGLSLASYLVAALFPLSAALAGWTGISPWDWALGGDPLVAATDPWRYIALAASSLALVIVGLVAFERRDVRSA